MSDTFFYLPLVALFFLVELLYFRIAGYFDIIDHPNERSSHSTVTLRGGGIIFPLAATIWTVYSGEYYWFAAGILIVSVVSFVDDLDHVSNLFRSGTQVASVALLLLQVSLPISLYWYVFILVLILGVINAWNFMDGINGITGAYSLVTIGTFYYINQYVDSFTDTYLLLAIMAALLVFNYFNFRKKAKCFAGDVGSVSIAFICCFLMTQLIKASGNLLFMGLFLIYGLDVVSTILFRLIRKENIFEAHRSHFYQFLANERGLPHLTVASLYAGVQLVVNLVVIRYSMAMAAGFNSVQLLLLCVMSAGLFLVVRWKVEGEGRLLGKKQV